MDSEYAVEMATSNIRYGPGATRELGPELVDRKPGFVERGDDLITGGCFFLPQDNAMRRETF